MLPLWACGEGEGGVRRADQREWLYRESPTRRVKSINFGSERRLSSRGSITR